MADSTQDISEMNQVAVECLKALHKNQLTIAMALQHCKTPEEWIIASQMLTEQTQEALAKVDEILKTSAAFRQQDNTKPLPYSQPRNAGLDHTDLNQE